MALAHEVRSFFGGKVRLRGHEYFERRAVNIDHGDAWNVTAWVNGTERYRVNLNRGPSARVRGSSSVIAWCTCPFANGGEACKHIWATVLAATAQGLLAGDGHQPVTDFRLSAFDDEEITAGFGDPLPPEIGAFDTDSDADADVYGSDDSDSDSDQPDDSDQADDADDFARPAPKAPASSPSPAGRSRDARDGREVRDRRDGRQGPGWRQQLATFLPPPTPPALAAPPPHAHTRQLVYVLDLEASGSNGSLTLEIGWRDRKVNGEWGRFRTKSYLRDEVMGASTPEDERILSLQHASDVGSNYTYGAYRRPVIANHIQLPPALVDVLLPGLCATGRCLLRRTPDDEEWAPLAWDAGDPWELRLELAREGDGEDPDELAQTQTADDRSAHPGADAGSHGDARSSGASSAPVASSASSASTASAATVSSGSSAPSARESSASSPRTAVATLDARETKDAGKPGTTSAREMCVLRGALHRGDERMEWSTALLILSGGHLVTPTHVARFTHRGDLGWIAFLAREGQLVIPCDELDALFAEMTKRPGAPLLDISPDLDVSLVKSPPRRRLSVRTAPDSGARPLPGDAVPAAPDAVRPRSDALRSASDSIRAAASRWNRADSARFDAARYRDAGGGRYGGGRDDARHGAASDEAEPQPPGSPGFGPDQRLTASRDTLHADVTFEYSYSRAVAPQDDESERGADGPRGAVSVRWDDATERLFVPGPPRTLIDRDRDVERDALRQLADAGLRPAQISGTGSRTVWELRASRLPDVVRRLISQGWAIEAEGRKHRTATATRAQVRSGIDWFDLEGVVEFGDISAPIGVIVAALARGETAITLSDGSQGLLPEEWLTRHGPWAGLAERRGDSVRFTRGQVAVLDAWITAAPAIDVDAQFAQAREALRAFTGVKAVDPPAEFQGELRAYQREGLGWIQFLSRFGFGGCLADDMGLGKTVQVLAALADRRAAAGAAAATATGRTRPSLVVVPRSLVFNWQREAARFAPALRVLDHTGPTRQRDGAGFDDADLIITTYGTVRRDAELLARIEFDYVILDEAHAIKNVDSLTTKAVRLLHGRHRLALTGTPVQNHIGELWSLFEFLNPGMLGRSRAFARAMNSGGSSANIAGSGSGSSGSGSGAGSSGPGSSAPVSSAPRDALARVLRPFILRRTKADVARDLPERVEDTIVCRLSGAERQRYNELRDYYRQTLAQRITKEGWNKARLHVLKALLRLRQAACHPGLVDRSQVHASSAKLDVLLADLRLLREEGHKTIVFSQFVRLLDIVRLSLDRDGVPYEYLDGRTRDREARVERFQTDPDCPLFLVSLKAGGLGLNLTAAEYVFLLDPWWNPAIEAQAIDRAHRIGQTRAVFAYRLIAEDTIEEKIIELQGRKRDLADAVVGADGGALQKLTREDLEVLLS